MNKISSRLAFDLGASSGRAILGHFDGQQIKLEEVHRFSNDPVLINGTLYWDILRLIHEIKQGLVAVKKYQPVDSLALDTWGVDFGLIDAKGHLLENPVHYRDQRTTGMMEAVFASIPRQELYQLTGTQCLPINTVYQLFALSRQRPELLSRADKLLLMPDLLLYLLTGVKQTEYTMASTSQLLDINQADWAYNLIERLGFDRNLFCPVIHPGQQVGTLTDAICEELAIEPLPVMAAASHDTASAVVAVPAGQDDFIYISSGTWSLMGIESKKPLVNDLTSRLNFTNEGGYNRTTRFLKNIMGLWLIQESRRQWIREGAQVSYADLEREALSCQPFSCLIDPDHESLAAPGDMPARIRDICRQTGQKVPQSRGEVMRCVYESLALKYRVTKDQIEQVTGRKYADIHIVGGGTKDALLSQFTADATGSRVIAGPIEATALGNIAVQLMADGRLSSLHQARQVIAASFSLKIYQPQEQKPWQQALERYRRLFPAD